MHDDRTSRGWPLPYKSNTLAEDVERIRAAFNLIDAELSGLETNYGTLSTRISTLENSIDTQINEKIAALETKLNEKNILGKLGFYIDEDGDLAQDPDHVDTGGDTPSTPDTPTDPLDNTELTTSEDVQELLDELFPH